MVVSGQYMYWANPATNSIGRASPDGSGAWQSTATTCAGALKGLRLAGKPRRHQHHPDLRHRGKPSQGRRSSTRVRSRSRQRDCRSLPRGRSTRPPAGLRRRRSIHLVALLGLVAGRIVVVATRADQRDAARGRRVHVHSSSCRRRRHPSLCNGDADAQRQPRQTNSLHGTVFDPTGRLYVANSGSNSVTGYASGAGGTAAPAVTIEGSGTGLERRPESPSTRAGTGKGQARRFVFMR
jgi:hypothetical protein